MHVGYSEKQKDFTTQKVQLYKKDFIVFSTDGYLDQFGGDRYKKIGRKRFLELIANIVNLEPEHQLGRINKQFQEWKGSNEQTDDVCTFGFTVE
jgi:serine phosphatase RsbU (regulator of sigma subunit)